MSYTISWTAIETTVWRNQIHNNRSEIVFPLTAIKMIEYWWWVVSLLLVTQIESATSHFSSSIISIHTHNTRHRQVTDLIINTWRLSRPTQAMADASEGRCVFLFPFYAPRTYFLFIPLRLSRYLGFCICRYG